MFLLSLILILACGPKAPLELTNPESYTHPECDKKSHLSAVGIGPSPSVAVANSHKMISEMVTSDLESSSTLISEVLDIIESEASRRKNKSKRTSTARQQFSTEIKIKSNFRHNNLIKDVIPPTKVGSEYKVLSCLNKRKAVRAISADVRPALDTFIEYSSKAVDDAKAGDWSGFPTHYSAAMELTTDILPDLVVIRAFSRSSLEQEYVEQLRMLESYAATLRSKTHIGLKITSAKGLSEIEKKDVLGVLRRSFERSGLQVSDAKSCDSKHSHYGDLKVQKTARRSGGGVYPHKFKLDLELELKECKTKVVTSVSIHHKAMLGRGYTADEARSKCFSQLPKANINPALKSELGGTLLLR